MIKPAVHVGKKELTSPVPADNQEKSASIRIPIRVKITLPYLILALLLLSGAALVVTQIVFDTIDERFTNQLIGSGKLAAETMVNKERKLLESLRLLSYADGLAEAIQQADAERARDLAFGITLNHRAEAVEILDERGNLLLSMRHREGGSIEDYEFSKDGDSAFLEWDFVRNTLNQGQDNLGDKYIGLVEAPWGDYVYVSGPVYAQDGDFAGVILVGKSLTQLVKDLREETLAQISLYDFDGQPLASTFEAVALADGEKTTVMDQQDEGSLRRSLDRRQINITNIEYDELLGPWEARGKMDLGLIGVSLPKAFYISPSLPTRLQISLLVFLALIFVVLMGVNLANYITRPLHGLVKASREVAQGNLQVKVDSTSNDELAVLANTFNQMVENLQKSQMDLLLAYDSTLEGWSRALDLRDRETEEHTRRVTEMTVILARRMGIGEEEIVHVRRGAILHDIGKVGVPDAILRKEGPLTDEEWEIIRKHPVHAYQMLWPIEYLRPALDIPYCHHERWDGTGYPRKLKGEEIPLSARIFAVVDVWDALSQDRVYRKAFSVEETLQHILAGKGKHFDPQVVDAFMELHSNSLESETD